MITILIVLLGGYIVLITQSSYLLDLVNKHCIVRERGFEIERNSPINNVNNYLSSTLFIADAGFFYFRLTIATTDSFHIIVRRNFHR